MSLFSLTFGDTRRPITTYNVELMLDEMGGKRRYLVSIDGDATNVKLARLICIENGVDPFEVYEERGCEVCVDPFTVYHDGAMLRCNIPTGDVPSAIARMSHLLYDPYVEVVARRSAGDMTPIPVGDGVIPAAHKYLIHSKVVVAPQSHVHQERILADIERCLVDLPREGVVIRTFDIGREEPCYLRGPSMGDDPVPEEAVYYAVRPPRAAASRMINAEPARTTVATAIVIDGVLATAFYGPLAPREPSDPGLTDDNREESVLFWAQHALVPEP